MQQPTSSTVPICTNKRKAEPLATPAEMRSCRGGGYIVKFKKEAVAPQDVEQVAVSICSELGIAPPNPRKIYARCLRGFSVKAVPEEVRAALEARAEVDSVELDIQMCAAAITPDASWALKRLGMNQNKPENSEGQKKVDAHVLVLDTGVQQDHPSLNVVESLSFIDYEPETDDFNGHGTMSAGCATGTAPGVKIHSYKVLDREGGGCLSDVVCGIERAVQYKQESGVKSLVLNLSLGAYVGTRSYIALDQELQEAIVEHGITAVVAAGNSSQDTALFSPGHVREAITVGAYAEDNTFANFSNFGELVDLLAPGEDVPTTGLRSSTTTASGTSFSSPYVAGLAAAFLAASPGGYATPEEVLKHLKENGSNNGSKNPAIRDVPQFTTTLSAYNA